MKYRFWSFRGNIHTLLQNSNNRKKINPIAVWSSTCDILNHKDLSFGTGESFLGIPGIPRHALSGNDSAIAIYLLIYLSIRDLFPEQKTGQVQPQRLYGGSQHHGWIGRGLSGLRDPAEGRGRGKLPPSRGPSRPRSTRPTKWRLFCLGCAAPGARGGGVSARRPSNCAPHPLPSPPHGSLAAARPVS